ncbi:GINS complex, Sld5 component [Thelephora terrestris]|uniref:DNA replication complex GINS protein SLD5 n=1 Tax=Thelephora terrestris TaxID=56493 RepID=A0A9P6L4K8_9AGAM|nr:GINS complex, Sld5 component [Thelephora terrestris]
MDTSSLNQIDFIAKARNASPSPPPRDGFLFTDLDDAQELPLQKLIRHWMNERHAPDILPIQAELLAGILDHIHKQSSTVSLLRTDPDASEDEHFRIMLAQTEIERVKFVVRSYVRTRLSKIEDYARWILADPLLQGRLSETELKHAKSYANLLATHFEESVLKALPGAQQSLDDPVPFMPPMITAPDKMRPVFVLARRDCPSVYLPDGTKMEMRKGQISLTQYRVIESLLFQDLVELV